MSINALIDELQRAGDPLVLAVKQKLDASRRKGQYVLTGSTNFLTTRRGVLANSGGGKARITRK